MLATYVLAYGALVLCTYALSLLHLVTARGMALALGLALALSGLAWRVAGRPALPSFRISMRRVPDPLRDPVLATAAIAVSLATAYSVALLIFTPQNEGDALAYHLPRAMFWRQAHALGYIPDAIETRLNVNPPNAEIGTLFTMLLSGSDRYVGLVQLLAYLTSTLAVYGIARRIGHGSRAALLGALLFAMLPVVALQASGALNDLLVASFLAVSAMFMLSRRTHHLIVAAVAVALALGTKFTALFGVPLLASIVLLGPARLRWRLVAALSVASAAFGSIWYGVNLAETGHLDGGLAASAGQSQKHTLGWIAVTFWRLCLDAFDLSGTAGSDVVAYLAAALLLLGTSLALRPRMTGHIDRVRATTLVVVTPFAVLGAGIALKSGVQHLLLLAGRDDMASVLPTGVFRPSGLADTTRSWYGPTGAMLAIVGPALAARLPRRGRVNAVALLLSVAPLVVVVELSVLLVYDQWRGRFAVFAFVLAAASWSSLLERRALAWAAVVVSATTLAMSLLHYLGKPSGAGALDVANPDVPTTTVWAKPRWYVQTLLRSDPAERAEGAVIQFVEQHVPRDAGLALALRGNDYVSPYFGENLSRTVSFVRRDGGSPTPSSTWLVLSPGADVRRCRSDWTPRLAYPSGWRVEQLTRRGSCNLPTNS